MAVTVAVRWSAIGLWSRVIDAPGAQPAVTVTHAAADFAHAAQFAVRPDPASGLTINVPAGTVAGDVMIATIATRPANTTPTNNSAVTICPPAGWTLVRDTINNAGGSTGGTGIRLQTWQRVAGAAEPAAGAEGWIAGHSDIAPGRKTDPGPCFDWTGLSRYTRN